MPASNVSQPAHNSVDWKISQACHGWFATYHVALTQMYKVGNIGSRTFTKAIEGLKWSQLRQTPVAGTIGGGLAGPISVHCYALERIERASLAPCQGGRIFTRWKLRKELIVAYIITVAAIQPFRLRLELRYLMVLLQIPPFFQETHDLVASWA